MPPKTIIFDASRQRRRSRAAILRRSACADRRILPPISDRLLQAPGDAMALRTCATPHFKWMPSNRLARRIDGRFSRHCANRSTRNPRSPRIAEHSLGDARRADDRSIRPPRKWTNSTLRPNFVRGRAFPNRRLRTHEPDVLYRITILYTSSYDMPHDLIFRWRERDRQPTETFSSAVTPPLAARRSPRVISQPLVRIEEP